METVVLYPAPGVGHIMSMVELGKLLLTHHSQSLDSIKITILIPSFPLPFPTTVLSYISSVSSSFPSIIFHFLPPIPPLHYDLHTYPDHEAIIFESLCINNANVLLALEELSSSSHVSAFVIDFFCYTSLEISSSLNIPPYFYFTSGAYALAFFLNFPVFDKIASDSFRNLKMMSFEIPRLFSVPLSQMIEPMLDRDISYYEFVQMAAHLSNSDGIIVNTFETFEGKAVNALKQGTCLLGTRISPVYCIGPLIVNPNEKDGGRHECLNWLDSQPSKTVVYLCFGSLGLFSKEQIWEIALGLERSGVRFLWVVRAPPGKRFEPLIEPDLESLLPEGFLVRTKDRGLVVKSWAPQIEVLGHDSVGGFVTHCGWNSTLEAVCHCVPMVTCPLYAEQRFNKIVLVEEIGIAIPVNESEDRFVRGDEIEKRVRQIIYSQEGEVVRKRVSELQVEAKVVFHDEGGSSKVMLRKLIESWKASKLSSAIIVDNITRLILNFDITLFTYMF